MDLYEVVLDVGALVRREAHAEGLGVLLAALSHDEIPFVLALQKVNGARSLQVRQEPDGVALDEALVQLDVARLTLRPIPAAGLIVVTLRPVTGVVVQVVKRRAAGGHGDGGRVGVGDGRGGGGGGGVEVLEEVKLVVVVMVVVIIENIGVGVIDGGGGGGGGGDVSWERRWRW